MADSNELYLEHVFINISKRQIKLLSEDGYEDKVTFKWDEEGAEGFFDTVNTIKENLPEELLTIHD